MIFFELFYPFATQMERISTLLNVRKLEFPPRFVRELPEEVPVFFTLPARSHHSKAFSIHLIIYIGHSPPITHSLQLKITNRSFWYAAPHLWNKQKLPPTLLLFLTNLVYHHPALCLQALVLGWLLTFLMTFFTRAVVEYSNIQIPK